MNFLQVAPARKFNRERQENKITMALVSVVCLFLVCQAPTAVMLTIKLFYHPPDKTTAANLLKVASKFDVLYDPIGLTEASTSSQPIFVRLSVPSTKSPILAFQFENLVSSFVRPHV